MDHDDLILLRELLTESRVLALALVDGGAPVAGLMPYLAYPALDGLLVHGSRLARHTRALAAGGPFSAVIHRPDRPEHDPLQLHRLMLEGEIHAIDKGEVPELRSRWTARFPMAALTVQLGDFAFYRLEIRSGRLIAGFARAFRVTPKALAEAALLPR
jgi:heme oxygenase (biliverdin-IX-beta and delta-forming)